MSPKERARLADAVLQNDVFKEALSELETELVTSWKATPRDDWRLREGLYGQLQALKDLKTKLENYIATAALDTTAK